MNRKFSCEYCGHATSYFDTRWTTDVLGYELRRVCPTCYETLMKNGYDNDLCVYDDVEYTKFKRVLNA